MDKAATKKQTSSPMTSEKKITKKELKGIFWRSMPMEASFNYERMMSIAFGFSMMGVIKKLYPKLHDQKEALKRHLEFFNCTSAMSPFILGVAASMEEKKANDPEFDVSSINAMKVGLMGPLAGIGDSFFWGTLRIIASGIGISLAKQGSVLGPLLFLVIYNVPNLLVRYYGTMLGYKTGVTFVEKMASGLMDNITFALNILGNTVIGGMIASMVIVKLPTKIAGGKDPQTIQTLLDSILPNAVPLLLTFFIAYLLKKKVNVFVILLVIIIISVLGAQFGFLGK